MELWKNRGMKGLFSKQKGESDLFIRHYSITQSSLLVEDPEFLDRQLKTRQALLKNLSRAVKEVTRDQCIIT
jgi:hypothetical protein